MTNSNYKHKLLEIVDVARFAPSVHNAQPWAVRLFPNDFSLEIDISKDRPLTFSDSTGRETYISLGIFIESCAIGAEKIGVAINEIKLTSGEAPIRIYFGARTSKATKQDQNSRLLKDRFTDRSIFQPTEIRYSVAESIRQSWQGRTSNIEVTTDQSIIETVANLTKKGQQLAFTSDEFRLELSEYIVASKKIPIGIAIPSLQVNWIKSKFSRIIVKKGWFKSLEERLEYRKWRSASGLVFVLSDGDLVAHWIEAGRAYLRASLAIQKAGLNQSTSAAIVEAADFHEDIEKLLGTKKRILSIIRIGKGVGFSDEYHSGRLNTDDIIVT